jgi:protein SCO1/2
MIKASRWIPALLALTVLSCARRAELPILPVGGDFVLTDQNRQRFELSSLRGSVVLIFFGYTSCPDVCPMTMAKLNTVYKKLGKDAERVKTVYITVDPGRDTPEVLKTDLAIFHIGAIGLTGTKAEIDKVVAQYGASYEITPAPQSEVKYTVSHSTNIYGLDTAGRTRILFPYESTADKIAKGIRDLLAQKS